MHKHLFADRRFQALDAHSFANVIGLHIPVVAHLMHIAVNVEEPPGIGLFRTDGLNAVAVLRDDPGAGIGCASGVGSDNPTGALSSCVIRCSSASTRVL